ncbi:MAG: hypothetical protein M1816_007696 [Peltula sp. TS41687]|nr:MAG: hypothetical protein M1816_007696 [Peltula sp. TS41687]
MDAAGDQDLKLQRKSADLLSDLEASLSRCLWEPGVELNARWLIERRQVERLLEPFQEWPQLLDPSLGTLLPPIVNAFIENLGAGHRSRTKRKRTGLAMGIVSCRYATCKLLYMFCKIRGQRVVSRFLNHEPRYFEPMLLAFRRWDAQLAAAEDTSDPIDQSLTWEERYVILLWLSQLLLAPFDIASISSAEMSWDEESLGMDLDDPQGLVWSAKYLTSLALKYIGSASKERESAQYILIRLSTRPDLQKAGLTDSLMRWAISSLSSDVQGDQRLSIYHHVGVLGYLSKVLQSFGHELASKYVSVVYHMAQAIASGQTAIHVGITSSALGRKALIKLFRTVACVSLAASSQPSPMTSLSTSSEVLEEVIEYLLLALADRETPVRYAASKAIGVVTVRLDQLWARDVVQAILESLAEDTIRTSAFADQKSHEDQSRSSDQALDQLDFTAVNAVRWHGLILTLARLLLYRSPPPEQLPEILEFLILALQFEQRTSTRSSIGANVRDAACFGIWALSRKYSTVELLSLDISKLRTARWYNDTISVQQILAIELVVAACLDPIGNIRRGASAALQELIGRHPDTILAGISIVQVVDYHAVALRSRAIVEVAVGASNLGALYWVALVNGLLGWRGLRSSDTGSRRAAAIGVGILSNVSNDGPSQAEALIDTVSVIMANLQARQVEEKHGMLLSMSAILDAVSSPSSATPCMEHINASTEDTVSTYVHARILRAALGALDKVTDRDFTSSVFHPELIAEAACQLVCAVSRFLDPVLKDGTLQPLPIYTEVVPATIAASTRILTGAFRRSDKEVIGASSKAAEALFHLLDEESRTKFVNTWALQVEHDSDKKGKTSTNRIAYLHALGAVFHWTTNGRNTDLLEDSSELEAPKRLIDALLSNTSPGVAIEVRIAALQSLANGVIAYNVTRPTWSGNEYLSTIFSILGNSITHSLYMCLDDYTIDSRGDIGSLVRLQAINAISLVLKTDVARNVLLKDNRKQSVLSRVVRLSAEKMDKVRVQAVACLHEAFVHFHPSLLDTLYAPDNAYKDASADEI